MGSFWLRSLKVKNFRSFRGEHEIQFPKSGMVLIRSENLDTGGSSGGGKSSVLLALSYALGFCPYPSTELQSWGADSTMQVELDFETTAGSYALSRGPKSTVLRLPTGVIVTGSKSVNDELRRATGLEPDMLSALTWRQQQERGRFLSKTNSEKQEFLSALLNLGSIEAVIEQSHKAVQDLEKEKAVAEERLKVATNAVLVAGSSQGHLEEVQDLTPFEEAVATWEHKALRSQEILVDVEKRYSDQMQAIADAVGKLRAEHTPAITQAAAIVTARKTEAAVSVPSAETTRLKQLLALSTEQLNTFKVQDREAAQTVLIEGMELSNRLAEAKARAGKEQSLQTERARLEVEVAQLRANTCPTCGQQWMDQQAKISERQARILDIVKEISASREATAEIPALEKKRQELKHTPDPRIAQMEQFVSTVSNQLAAEEAKASSERQLQIATASAEVARLQAALNAAIENVNLTEGTKLEALRVEVQTAKMLANNAHSEWERAKLTLAHTLKTNEFARAQRQRYETAIKQAEDDRAAAVAAVDKVVGKIALELDLVRLLGREGFMGVIFDEILTEISVETNAILRRVANTAHVVIDFQSESVTQKGSVKKEIRPVVSIGGHEAPLDSGCSGGMRTAISLAVDIAVRRVISRRTGSFPGWLALDEAFDGLDQVSKEACMEILVDAGADNLMLVIDHGSEFKEMFSQFISLRYSNGTTSVQ